MEAEQLLQRIGELRSRLETVIRGKHDAIDLLLTALLAGGNVLMDDVPGVGKTTLAKALAFSLDAEFKRIQFTPDLLPADILGAAVFNPKTLDFIFHKGPVFTNILLADEINRASPRTQSALLEAMNEKQVSLDGTLYPLPDPFLVIATENPVEYFGTYPLPEAQLDRFSIRLQLGYPDRASELAMLEDRKKGDPLDSLKPCLTRNELLSARDSVSDVALEQSLAKYMLSVVDATRHDSRIRLGASPRALLMLARCARAKAWLAGRKYVIPEDIRQLFHPVLAHRLALDVQALHSGVTAHELIDEIMKTTKVPA